MKNSQKDQTTETPIETTDADHGAIGKKLSRRTFLKIGAGGLAAAGAYAFTANKVLDGDVSSKKCRIVIAGGGMAGCSIANRLSRQLCNAKITIIEPDENSVTYQPGQTLVGAGIWQLDDILAKSAAYFPETAEWVKDYVVEFAPHKNRVVTGSGQTIPYDFLVVATGLQLNYADIDGMSEDLIGQKGITSIYHRTGCLKSQAVFQEYIEKGTSGAKPMQWLFTHPDTPIKCAGAPKKIAFLTQERLMKEGLDSCCNLSFFTADENLFGVTEYHNALEKVFEQKKIAANFKHTLRAIDPDKKEATFDYKYAVKGEYDADLEEYETIQKTKSVRVPYDCIHVTPPMHAPDAVRTSELAWQKGSAAKGGWVEVDPETLQHRRFPNVFCLGDAAGIPMAKTGASIRVQYKIVADNLVAAIEENDICYRYNGYTVCPIVTGIGKVIFAEFDYSGRPNTSLPIDPKQERYMWWLFKVYLTKPMVYMGMLRGWV